MRRICLIIGLLANGAFAAAPTPVPPKVRIWSEPQTGIPFVQIDKGCFRMGSKSMPFKLNSQPLVEAGYKGDYSADERPAHEACLAAYWIGQFEVRADEWERVMKSPPPKGKGQEPASGVSWSEAMRFAELLTAASAGQSVFRLPTEAEWENACLAGRAELLQSPWDRSALAPFAVANRLGPENRLTPQPLPAGSRQANPWGLFDMQGNVSEWVQDAYAADAYRRHKLFNPLVSNKSGNRALRGGSHRSEIMHLRCANRAWYPETESLPSIGFRLVRKAVP